jgi:hypothetical protein
MAEDKPNKEVKVINKYNGPGGWIFFAAWLGALFYFLEQAHTFTESIMAFLKSVIWPALVLYRVLELLKL